MSTFDEIDSPALTNLEGRHLSSVWFDRMITRLQFDGPEIVLPSSFTVSAGAAKLKFGEPGTRDLLRSFIASTVLRITRPHAQCIKIEVTDGRTLTLEAAERE